MNVQLNVEGLFIDLYATDPIKLNFSIEDITNAEAKSIYSRNFRVPASTNNYQFFKTAFMVNGIDFDVTKKYNASILVDGNEFRTGHIRLQKVYYNGSGNIVDYEILFLGETKDFGAAVGQKTLCELVMSDLHHEYTMANVEASWNAYPEGIITDGLIDGDVLYPLIDFGNTYDGTTPNESQVSIDGSKSFTSSGGTHALPFYRFKPMIRAKRIIDQIFDDAGFSYTSEFFNSDLFKQMYVSAFGSDDINIPLGSANHLQVQYYIEVGLEPVGGTLKPDRVVLDPVSNYNPDTGIYLAPVDGDYNLRVLGTLKYSAAPGSGGCSVRMRCMVNGIEQAAYTATASTTLENFISYLTYDTTDTLTLSAGDSLYCIYEVTSGTANFFSAVSHTMIIDSQTTTGSNTATMAPEVFLDCEYKQIDFVKDILKKFRLVMSPDRNTPGNFIIEPWSEYITTGDFYDWTQRVDTSKDWVIEPLFFTQTDKITFQDAGDGDWLQDLNEKAFKETFGTLKFESLNELLKGQKTIECTFASTPIGPIHGGSVALPQLHQHESEDGETLHTPIKPVTRLLFYNGLLPFNAVEGKDWHSIDENSVKTAYSTYPLVSYNENWPPTSISLNLNWQTETGYMATSGINEIGVSVYERYWGNYISQLYDPYARRVTMYVNLDSVDLQYFSFDDLVFIKDTFYYVEKITDVPIGQRANVRIDLIKVLDTVTGTGEPPVPPVEPVDPWNRIDTDFDKETDEWQVK